MLTAKELEQIRARWHPLAYLSRLPGDREDVAELLRHVEEQQQKLNECHGLLCAILECDRPIPAGWKLEVLELLEAHGMAKRREAV